MFDYFYVPKLQLRMLSMMIDMNCIMLQLKE